ncbi:hypothetical protein [Bacillus gaemokensis]|uniref:hypothetical protein n=1 Tax=Bacillus gaemokensis TaxID=574375 RepID=UPI00068C3999|nr:hypothetical protein [Bacillus gaemokensis]KYG38075.1 hypothetical protein AZF08_20160 [Bacillus gaemokensis]
MDKDILRLPVKFEQVSNVLDDRFVRTKIYIAHEGENRNRCIFTKEILESMIPSLANVPILGYIAVDELGNDDFKGHEEALMVENNEFKIKYLGHAYGVIPEDNNARFETRYGEDGVEREYLVADGILWRKFPEVEEIFDRDGGFKSQSMELQHSSVKGYQDEHGLFVFTQAKFEGLCILGEGVTPAMISSTIEKFSFADKFQTELSAMLTEFNAHFTTTSKEGEKVTKVIDNPENTEPQVQELEVTEPVALEPETDFAKKAKKDEDEDKDKGKDSETDDETSNEDPEEPETEDDDEDEEKGKKKPKKFSRTFELSHDDIRSGIYNALSSHNDFQDSWMWVSKVYDNHAIVEDADSGKYFKVNYVKHENAVSIGEHEELFPMFLSASEKNSIDATRNNFEALETEVTSLREFKSNIELAEKEQKLSQYSASLSKEEFQTIKDNLTNFSMDDIEKEIGFMLLKKNHFSAQPEETHNRVPVTNTENSFQYGGLSTYFSK